ncbi:MAG: hypothetical protein OXC01_14155 [Immundisolibacterales bacterium]|nr:hypothetical protein [Immundisolibacterales bacterium]
MAINLTHRPDLEERVERLAARLALEGRGRKTATIERALTALEERLASDRPDRGAIEASIDRYIEAGLRLRERLSGTVLPDYAPALSLSLQEDLYTERGLPR